MSDYLENLLARQLERLETVEPRRPSRFEPPEATLPPDAGRLGDAPQGYARESGDEFRAEAAETFKDAPDTSASSPDASTRMSPMSPPRRRAPFAPPQDEAPAPPYSAHESLRPLQPPSAFEPESAETLLPFEPTRPQPFGLDDDTADTLIPSTASSSSPTPEIPSAPARRPATEEARAAENGPQARATPQASPRAEGDDAPRPVEPSAPSETSAPKVSRRKAGVNEARAEVADSRSTAPPTVETLLVPVLDARETPRRAAPAPNTALAHETEARTTRPEAQPPVRQPAMTPTARADEPVAKRAAVELAETPARRERRESSEVEALKPRRERQRREASAVVEPRVTRRAEARAAALRQADAQAKAEPAPTINVTIGRIEIRATAPASRPAARRAPAGASPMSLEDYLRRRGGGGGR